MAQVTPLAAVEAMKSRVDSIAGANMATCQPEMYKLPMRQRSVTTRLPPKAPGPAAQNTPAHAGSGSNPQNQRLSASFTQLKPAAARRPGTAPATGQKDGMAAYGESLLASTAHRSNGSSRGKRAEPVASLPSPQPGAVSSVLPGYLQQEMHRHLPAAVTAQESNRKLRACHSARSSHLQRYLETPSCTPASRTPVVHGTAPRPVDKPGAAPAEEAQQPLAVGAFWDSTEARVPTTDANGAVGMDLLTYMTSTAYAASAAHTGDGGDGCRPSTVPNMRSSARRQSSQEGSKARPSTSCVAQHPRLDAIIGPWDSTPGELQLQGTYTPHGRILFILLCALSLCRRGACYAKRGPSPSTAVGGAVPAAQHRRWRGQGRGGGCRRTGGPSCSVGRDASRADQRGGRW